MIKSSINKNLRLYAESISYGRNAQTINNLSRKISDSFYCLSEEDKKRYYNLLPAHIQKEFSSEPSNTK